MDFFEILVLNCFQNVFIFRVTNPIPNELNMQTKNGAKVKIILLVSKSVVFVCISKASDIFLEVILCKT